jgi:hypothetical protein
MRRAQYGSRFLLLSHIPGLLLSLISRYKAAEQECGYPFNMVSCFSLLGFTRFIPHSLFYRTHLTVNQKEHTAREATTTS